MVGSMVAVLAVTAWWGSTAGGSQDSKGSVHILIKTAVDHRQDPAGAGVSSCELYEAKPETIVAKGTFGVFPFALFGRHHQRLSIPIQPIRVVGVLARACH